MKKHQNNLPVQEELLHEDEEEDDKIKCHFKKNLDNGNIRPTSRKLHEP